MMYGNESGFHNYMDAEPSLSYANEVLRRLRLPKAPRVLDVASGKGNEAAQIQEIFGGKVFETDASPFAFSPGQSRDFVFAEINHQPFPDNSFDLVHSKDSYVHVADKQGFFLEARRVLKPDGKLLLATQCPYNIEPEKTKNYFTILSGTERIYVFFSGLEDYQNKIKSVRREAEPGTEISPPYFNSYYREIVDGAKNQGLIQIKDELPEFWHPQKTEKNWGDFNREVFLFKASK